jgi:hypothetical protein
MIKQYPHILYTIQPAENSTRDDEGNWISGSPDDIKISECREIPDGRGKEVIGADGKHHVYSSMIFLPASCPEIPEGTVIYVKASEAATKKRIEGPVLKFDQGQMHSRIWV